MGAWEICRRPHMALRECFISILPSVLGHKCCSFFRAGLEDDLDWILLARYYILGRPGLPGSAADTMQQEQKGLGKSDPLCLGNLQGSLATAIDI